MLSAAAAVACLFGVTAAGAQPATSVSAGTFQSCGLLSDERVECWGWNKSGVLGNGEVANPLTEDVRVPVFVVGLTDAVSVSTGAGVTCAVRSGGTVVCWGVESELGNGSTGAGVAPTPTAVSGISNAVAVSAGVSQTCALLSDGGIDCWGDGARGDGSTLPAYAPVKVSGISNAVAVSAGGGHACARLSDATVKCWGDDSYGQLGSGVTGVYAATPVSVSGLSNAVSVSAGGSHTCAELSTGHVDCWGSDQDGQLGDNQAGGPGVKNVPTAVSGITNAAAVSAGGEHSCAVLSTGEVSCWGKNLYGQLGDGEAGPEHLVPVTVASLHNAITVSAGGSHTCALLADGSMDCWGFNGEGQLGSGEAVLNSTVPVRVLEPVTPKPPIPCIGLQCTKTPIPCSCGPLPPKPKRPPKPISAAVAFSLPSTHQCVSRRHFTIHVRKLPGIIWVKATVKINKRQLTTLKRKQITARVTLVGLPKGTFKLTITATARDGRKATGSRTYHTCVPKRKRHYAPPKL